MKTVTVLVATMFAAALGLTSTVRAADPEITANSIFKTFSDYCDPAAFDRERPADARWDRAVVQNFARVLITRDGANCEKFENLEVYPARATFELLARLPELQRTPPRSLTGDELGLIASTLFVDDILAGNCTLTAPETLNLNALRALTTGLRQKLTHDDALDLARAYSGRRLYWRAAYGFPPKLKVATPCEIAPTVSGVALMSAVSLGLIAEDELATGESQGMSTEEFKQFGEHLNDDGEQSEVAPDANVAIADQPTESDEPAIGDYVWEPGDPGTDRGNGDQPIDLTPYVASSDVEAVAPFTGLWGNTAACDEGHTFLMGQFGWQDGMPVFGTSVPRISTEHLSCEAGQWSVSGDIATFNALCHPDDEGAWSGTGTIRWVSKNAVQLSLLDEPEPTRLELCRNQPFARRDASSAAD